MTDLAFDLNVYLYNKERLVFDENENVFNLLNKYNASVVDCSLEKSELITNELNGHNFFIIFSDGSNPIGFSCPKERNAVIDMVINILNNKNNG